MTRYLLALAGSLGLHAAVGHISLDWYPPAAPEIRPCRVQLLQSETPRAALSTHLPLPTPPRRALSDRPTASPSTGMPGDRLRVRKPAKNTKPTGLGVGAGTLESSDDYPRARGRVAHPRPPAQERRTSQGVSGQSLLEAPVLIRGPETIPLPEFLQNRDGHFRLSLKCRIEPDSSSRVEVWDSTGCPDLDESVRESFSGRNWYPALLEGKPVGCTVRLTVESSWKQGESAIDWGGRVPGADLARY